MKSYLRFKKWAKQEKIQKIRGKFTLGVAVLVVLLAILATNDTALSRVLGLSTQATPTPSPTVTSLPTNTPTPTPVKKVQEATTPKYDGTRTGRIIKYKKWCGKEEEEIQIYENELLAGKAADGKTYYMIQSDWECYARYLAGPPQTGNQQNTTNSQNLILESAKINAKYLTAQLCISSSKTEADKCNNTCLSTNYQDVEICKFARDNGVWETDRYDECRDEVYVKYKSCLDTCTNDMMAKNNQCLEEQKK